jgi:hypothetical protein
MASPLLAREAVISLSPIVNHALYFARFLLPEGMKIVRKADLLWNRMQDSEDRNQKKQSRGTENAKKINNESV